MSKTIYDQVLEMLKKNKEVEIYRFAFDEAGKFDFYTKKVYTAEDGEEIKCSVVLASVFGVIYRLDKIKCVGTALIKGKSCIVREYINFDNEPTYDLYYGDINGYSFSITEAMMKERDENRLYFLGKDGSLYAFEKDEESKGKIELLLSKGLISKFEDFKEEIKW